MIKKFDDFVSYKKNGNSEIKEGDFIYIDLGLPSGTLWADRNVGASSPEDYGNYYAWGEIEPKNEYSHETYKYAIPHDEVPKTWRYIYGEEISKYGNKDGKRRIRKEDDVVCVLSKGTAHIPNITQIRELIRGTKQEINTINNVKGLLFKSKRNDNNIFIPFAGAMIDDKLNYDGGSALCWSNLVYGEVIDQAFNLECDGREPFCDMSTELRYSGLTVRGVMDNKYLQ